MLLECRFLLRVEQVVCVTRFDQSECVICSVILALGKSRFQKYTWWNFRFVFQACVGNFITIPHGKLLEHFILIEIALVLNILLSWAFVTSLNCSVMCKPPWWFECYFRCSSWIHCGILLAVLSDYFGQPFFFVNFGVYPGLPLLVSPLWGVESVLEWRDCPSQVQVLGNGLRNLPKRKPTWSE